MAVKQTAGRDQLGDFAPKFAQLNDDVLFGEVWSREDKLSLRDRSLVTVIALARRSARQLVLALSGGSPGRERLKRVARTGNGRGIFDFKVKEQLT